MKGHPQVAQLMMAELGLRPDSLDSVAHDAFFQPTVPPDSQLVLPAAAKQGRSKAAKAC